MTADQTFENYRKPRRRDEFLKTMDVIVPWAAVCAVFESYYPRPAMAGLIACVDGLKNFPDTIETVYPTTSVQLCPVHLVRHNLNYVSWTLRTAVAPDSKTVHEASTVDEA